MCHYCNQHKKLMKAYYKICIPWYEVNYISGITFTQTVILMARMLEQGIYFDSTQFTLSEIESILYSFNEATK